MVSTQSAADAGGRKLVPKLQRQQLAVVSSHVEQPSNLAELLLGILFSITYQYSWLQRVSTSGSYKGG